MKQDNNGKIAIAIVAMFVVALSIVGITYAYFTVSVVGNKTEKSVEVQAGVLEIVYTEGNEIDAKNIVPGWISDGEHYFDSKLSSYIPAETDLNGNGVYDSDVVGETAVMKDGKEVKAVKAVTKAECEAAGDGCAQQNPTKDDGITGPVTFSVANTSRNAGDNAYIVKLVEISNGIAQNNASDAENLTYELYSTTTENATTGGTLIGKGALSTGADQVIVNKALTIGKNDGEQYYYLMLKYANVDNQDASKNAVVKATVQVVGAVYDNTTSKWMDANGDQITFATEPSE